MNLEDDDGPGSTNRIRDAIARADPELAGLVMARDRVVDKWCAEHGKDKDTLEIADVIAIRALPEWQGA